MIPLCIAVVAGFVVCWAQYATDRESERIIDEVVSDLARAKEWAMDQSDRKVRYACQASIA